MTDAADRLRAWAYGESEKKVAMAYRFQRSMARALREGAKAIDREAIALPWDNPTSNECGAMEHGIGTAVGMLLALADELEGKHD